MNKFFFAPLIALAIFIGATGFTSTAHATMCMGMDLTGDALTNCQASEAENAAVTPGYDANAIQNSNDAAMQAAQKAAANTVTGPEGINSGFGPIMSWIASLFAWLVGVAALTLDFAVYFTIIKMGDYVHNLSAVGVTWRILRDIGNIALIFGFLAIGISTILNTERLGWGKKMLPMLLVAAVFINFSLFFTEAVIDTGNIFATQFFTQINGGEQPTADFLSKTTVGSEGISNKIMAQVGLQTIYTQGQVRPEVFKGQNTWLIGFMSILLFIVTAFVMFSLAFILVARFVFLIFLIVLAPLGFAGLAIPQLSARAKWWWDSLFEQTITAPVLLLLLYIALAVITDASFLTGLGAASPNAGSGASWVGFIDGSLTGFGSLLLTFMVAMGLLLVVVIVSKRISAVGASGATKLAGKLSFGATAWAGRTTIGWGANKGAKYLRTTRLARTPLVGTGLVKGLDKLAGGSFDVRGVKAGGGLKGVGVEAGDAQKGGYKADLKARIESRTKYAADLKGRELTDEEKMMQASAQADIKARDKDVKAAGANWANLTAGRNRTLADLDERLQKGELTKGEHTAFVQATHDSTKDSIAEATERLKKTKEEKEKSEKELAAIESVTDKGAKLEYAKALNLWTDEKNTFNKYFNFAANTEAAKKIREEAKKSKDDKTLDSLKKAIEKASVGGEKEEKEEKPKEEKTEGGAH